MNKIKNYWWYMIVFVCFIIVINYLDRMVLGIVVLMIMEIIGIIKE